MYSASDFSTDAQVTARTMHLAYRRAKFLLDRWWAGGQSAHFPNEGDGIAMNSLMNRVAELVADYEAGGNAKLGTIMVMSNLQLPGDA